MNFFDGPEKAFFHTFADMKADADSHWFRMWGCDRCGPFNTDCLAIPGHHLGPSGHTCVKTPQKLPP